MKNVPVNEMTELQRSIQETNARANDIYKFIGKMYYEQTKDSPSADFEPHFKALKESLDKIKQLEARIKFLNGIVVCSNCGMENGVKSAFCEGCGTRLPHTYTSDGTNRCDRCGAVLNPGRKFCGACGAPAVEKQEASSVATPVVSPAEPLKEVAPVPAAATIEPVSVEAPAAVPVVDKSFCPNCGMEITESDSIFCSGCGCKLN